MKSVAGSCSWLIRAIDLIALYSWQQIHFISFLRTGTVNFFKKNGEVQYGLHTSICKNKNITQTMLLVQVHVPLHFLAYTGTLKNNIGLKKTFCPLFQILIRLASWLSWLSHAKPSSKSRHQTQSQSKDVGKQ